MYIHTAQQFFLLISLSVSLCVCLSLSVLSLSLSLSLSRHIKRIYILTLLYNTQTNIRANPYVILITTNVGGTL